MSDGVFLARSQVASIHEMPRRGLLGNPYSESCIALDRYVCPLSRRTGAIGDVGHKGPAVRVSKPIE